MSHNSISIYRKKYMCVCPPNNMELSDVRVRGINKKKNNTFFNC